MKRLWRFITRDLLQPGTDRQGVCGLLLFPLMLAAGTAMALAMLQKHWFELGCIVVIFTAGSMLVIHSEYPEG